MNRGNRMSSALALVTPRAVVESSDVAQSDGLASPRRTDGTGAGVEPSLAVVAQVPILHGEQATKNAAKDTATPRSWKLRWNPNWKAPRPKFRLAYVKVAAALMHLDIAACWAWAISLPPIVKLGTIMASVVMSLWMFGGGEADPPVEAPPPAWHQDGEAVTQYSAAHAGDEKPKPSAVADGRSAPADSPRVASDRPHDTGPTIREIQEAAGAARSSSKFDDRWPDEMARDERVAVATVRPIPSHREPYSRDEMPIDATPRGISGRDVGGNARPIDAGPRPPADMPRRWAERPQPGQTSDYSPIQVNPYYADTAVARTPSRSFDNRSRHDRPDNRATNDRFADRRFADDRFAPQTAAEREAAQRRAYEDDRARAYRIGRDRAPVQRHYEPETYRR